MKLNKIKTLCVRTGSLLIFNELSEDGELRGQWISNGAAMWRLTGLPTIGTENIPALLGMSAKQVEQTLISLQEFPESYNAEDYDSADVVLQAARIRIKENGRENMILYGSGITLTVDAALLAPVWTEDAQIILRRNTNGKPYIVLMDGFFIAGIIMPTENILQEPDKMVLTELMRK